MENIANIQLPFPAPILLSRLARSTVQDALLARIHDAEIYQVASGWQYEVLRSEEGMVEVLDQAAFKVALADPSMMQILVPKDSTIRQDEAVRILQANRLEKTIFWEIRSKL
jgi:hypothetical protein